MEDKGIVCSECGEHLCFCGLCHCCFPLLMIEPSSDGLVLVDSEGKLWESK